MRKALCVFHITLFFLIELGSTVAFGSNESLPMVGVAKSTLIRESDERKLTKEDVSKGYRPFRAPDYSSQEGALGYSLDTFSVLPGMEERVSFWLDIYTQLTSDQGYLHDSENVNLVYKKLEFSDIESRVDLSNRQRQRLRELRISDEKKNIEQRLLKLHRHSSSAGLIGEELRFWVLFHEVTEKDKFLKAAKKNRLRFQLGQKDHFAKAIERSGRFIEQMEKEFRSHGLPLELARLPFVESSFNMKAVSKAGASGIWQFMRGTAKRYLKVNNLVDERNAPLLATQAAVRLLKNNFELLGNWPLAVTGYNHGPWGIKKLVNKYNTGNLVDLLGVRDGSFGFASANFYACFLAALIAEKKALELFTDIKWQHAAEFETLILSKNVTYQTLVSWFEGDEEQARLMNYHLTQELRRGQWSIPKGIKIRIPKGRSEEIMVRIAQMESAPKMLYRRYRVQQGDTLQKIARKLSLTLEHIISVNRIKNPRHLVVGQYLKYLE